MEYGNITFGEVSRLLIDIFGQNAILVHRTKKEKKAEKIKEACKRMLERMYKGKANYQNLFSDNFEYPNRYVNQFFEEVLEKQYGFPHPVKMILDSLIWRLIFTIMWETPFEKSKQKNTLLLIRTNLFSYIYDLLRGQAFIGNDRINIPADSIIEFLTDSYDKILSEIRSGIIHREFMEKFADYKTNFENWRHGKNAQWETLVPILDFLDENDETKFVHRLIGLYLRNNAQRAIQNIWEISEIEQEKIIAEIIAMINDKKMPEEMFRKEKDSEYLDKIKLIYLCQAYHFQDGFDIKNQMK